MTNLIHLDGVGGCRCQPRNIGECPLAEITVLTRDYRKTMAEATTMIAVPTTQI